MSKNFSIFLPKYNPRSVALSGSFGPREDVLGEACPRDPGHPFMNFEKNSPKNFKINFQKNFQKNYSFPGLHEFPKEFQNKFPKELLTPNIFKNSYGHQNFKIILSMYYKWTICQWPRNLLQNLSRTGPSLSNTWVGVPMVVYTRLKMVGL